MTSLLRRRFLESSCNLLLPRKRLREEPKERLYRSLVNDSRDLNLVIQFQRAGNPRDQPLQLRNKWASEEPITKGNFIIATITAGKFLDKRKPKF